MLIHVSPSDLLLPLVIVSMVSCQGQTTTRKITSNTQRAGPECRLRQDVGTCSGAEVRYYYDAQTGRCAKFTYTGCGGNINNFLTKTQCHQRCLCSLPRRKGSCNRSFDRFYYNQDSGKCEQFRYSGCGGNPNNFVTRQQCVDLCEVQEREPNACQQRPKVGTCSSKNRRYYFDFNCKCCRSFIWSGCDGENGNNFGKKELCEIHCGAITSSTPSTTTTTSTSTTTPTTTTATTTTTTSTTTTTTPTTTTATTSTATITPTTSTTSTLPPSVMCLLQPDKGTCDRTVWRYYFDTRCDCCRLFSYTGCGGNKNNFVTIQDCRRACAVSGKK